MDHVSEQYLRTYQSSQQYLRLSHAYAEYLGGLRWSSAEDAVIYSSGKLFSFSAAIAEFVDGFASQGHVPLFGYLLHWMDLLQNQRGLEDPMIQRLRAVFEECGSNWFNAGAFAATLSKQLPEVPQPPDLELVGKRLRDHSFPIRWFTAQFHELEVAATHPPVPPAEFEDQAIGALEAFNVEELRAWLKMGRGPIKNAERLAEPPPMPRSLARALASLSDRPRLAGAHAHVAQLVGALALPPRRLMPQQLPVGGYTDIIMRGQPEHLLPAQFALDEIEFLRRFAEKELLYFRREEPPLQNRQEMVVLLDQGVRAWGDVRLVLTAAALALGKQALLRKTPFLLAATSNDGVVVDPSGAEEEALGRLVEASDLSLNPGLALERVLETPSAVLRDVVLLTQPRNLRESDVLNASRRLGPRDRLFAVALDRHGQVEVSEVRRGTPILVRRFHVDFAPSLPRPRRPARPDAAGAASWTGDLEAIPFPFRLGTAQHVLHFDFDWDAQWLLTVSAEGILHLWHLDGSGFEMLPRPCTETVFKIVLGVTGVKGGFVLACLRGDQPLLAHYDVVRRHCNLYPLLGATDADSAVFHYVVEQHCLCVRYGNTGSTHILDLDTGVVCSTEAADTMPARAWRAWQQVAEEKVLPNNRELALAKHCELGKYTGALTVQALGQAWGPWSLRMNGQSCFTRAHLRSAQLAGSTVALRALRKDIGDSITLVQAPEGAILREYPVIRPQIRIVRHRLSFDGKRIALLSSDQRVEVEPVADRSLPSVRTRAGGYAMEAKLYVGSQCLLLNPGSNGALWHLFDWAGGKLQHRCEKKSVTARESLTFVKQHPFGALLSRGPLASAEPAQLPKICQADPARYVAGVRQKYLWFVLDRYGQVAVLDDQERLLAMFVAFRDRFAAWLPDGTRFGSLAAETPSAAEKIGRALS